MNERRRKGARPTGPRPANARPANARRPKRTSPTRGPSSSGSDIEPERLVYGRHPVREAARGQRKIHELFLTANASADIGALVANLKRSGVAVHENVEPSRVDSLAGTSDHQGAVARVSDYPYVSVDQLLAHAKKQGENPLIFCLDGITDPHNLGAIARVADASGATGLIIPEHRSARVTGAAVKASAGALEHVKVARCTNLAKELSRITGPDLWAFAATERGQREWTEIDLAGGALVVLGAEGPGIRPGVLAACDEEVQIPMAGGVASLNVSTVSAIFAFEAVRQRRANK